MNQSNFPHLFCELKVGPITLKNRIFSSGHQTVMNTNGLPTDQMIAYQSAKAKGGAGLIITESSRPHETALQLGYYMDVSTDRCIDSLSRMAAAVKAHGAHIFGQLGHPGALAIRRLNGVHKPVYSASVVHGNRFKNVARALSLSQIDDIVLAYASAAVRYSKAGYDGIEIMASHGVLPAQFLNPKVNHRTDEYGGSAENRSRFTLEILRAVRAAIGPDMVLGIRLSLDEKEEQCGLSPEQTLPLCKVLDGEGLVDYFNITGGTMSTERSSVNVVPPMGFDAEYLHTDSAHLKSLVSRPVFFAGRINQPQIAEGLLEKNIVDLCGMTRAMIADPNMPVKAKEGRVDDIVACIACNQGCIEHMMSGEPVSCIQTPSTGRECELSATPDAVESQKVLVIGGGPAGMQAAVTAAERGHEVTLHEASSLLGGKALLAQLLPGREEFGGLVTNLQHKLEKLGVQVNLNSKVTAHSTVLQECNSVIMATGSTPHLPDPELFDGMQVIHAEAILSGQSPSNSSVVVYDWRGDWVAIGVAERLAREGYVVTFVTEDNGIGQLMPSYVRSDLIGRCHRLGVKFEINTRLYGAQDDTVFLTHALSGEPVMIEDIDTLVLATGTTPEVTLEPALSASGKTYQVIGDCLSPRSAEEAVYEGWKAGLAI